MERAGVITYVTTVLVGSYTFKVAKLFEMRPGVVSGLEVHKCS